MTPPPLHTILSTLLLLWGGGGITLAAAMADKYIQTVYIQFNTYNAAGITAWEVMEFGAQMHEGSSFDYKDFLAATVGLVWDEIISGKDGINVVEGGGRKMLGESEGEDKDSKKRELRAKVDTNDLNPALALLTYPISFGVDTPCPDPPGWIPPIPIDGYTCQSFKASLEIEVDRTKIPEHYHTLSSALSAIELELAIGAHVQNKYMKAIDDGTMERKLIYIEGGRGDMRILWDDPNLRTAWRRYGPNTEVNYQNDNNGGGGGGPAVDTRVIVGSSIVGGVMFFFLLSVCVNGCAGNMADKKAQKEGDDFANESPEGGNNNDETGTTGVSALGSDALPPPESSGGGEDGNGASSTIVGDGGYDDEEEREVDLPPIT